MVEKVEINANQDAAGQQREAAASVATLQAAGATAVVVLVGFTVNPAFFDEAEKTGAGFEYMLLDASASICTQFGASRTPAIIADVAGAVRDHVGHPGAPDQGRREARQRVRGRSAARSSTRGSTRRPRPGVPSGDITDATGQTLTEDFSPNECIITDLFVQGLKKAGKNATPEDVYDAMLTIKKSPAAYMSNGTGGFAKNKPYFANQVHVELLNPATTGHRARRQRPLQRLPGADQLLGAAGRRRDRVGRAQGSGLNRRLDPGALTQTPSAGYGCARKSDGSSGTGGSRRIRGDP